MVVVVASFRVPVRTPVRPPGAELEELVRKGPDSYFHHIFDPDKLLGLTGQVDLTLDNFERETSHGVLFAALPTYPRDVPEFTVHAAEVWQPGVGGADNGIIVFIFPADRHVRVEVGYGLESALPDIEVHRLLEATFLPAARAGDLSAGVEALIPPLLERLRTVPRAEPKPRGRFHDLAVAGQEIPRRARLVWAVWLAGLPELRLTIGAIAALGTAFFAVLLARIAHTALLLVRRLRVRADTGRVAGTTIELVNGVLRLAQVAFILFVMAVGTSFFFPGTGSFGGAGVDLHWEDGTSLR